MIYCFANCELNTVTRQLLVDRQVISIEPRAFDLLVYFLTNPDRVITKEEIIEAVWAGRFTSDAALATTLKVLRKAIGDTGDAQRLIQTVRSRGFRFVAPINRVDTIVTTTVDRQHAPSAVPGIENVISGKPSIVVLPFVVSTQAPVGKLIAEGLAHELIQSLSRLRWLRVIARATAFRFAESTENWQTLAEKYRVRYGLSGELDLDSKQPVLSLELSDTISAEVLWAGRISQPLEEMRGMNSLVVREIVNALELHIPANEASAASLRSSEHLDAWENYHLGLRHMFCFSAQNNAQAASFFAAAIKQDSSFARAHAALSFTRFQDAFLGYSADRESAKNDARTLAEKGLMLDALDPFTNFNFGRSFWLEGDAASSLGWLQKSIELSPNFAQGHYALAFGSAMLGETKATEQSVAESINLSPLDPLLFAFYAVQAMSKIESGQIDEATLLADQAAKTPGAHYLIHMIATATYSEGGNKSKAEFWRQRALSNNPGANITDFFLAIPVVSPVLKQKMRSGLERAGFT